MTSQDDHKHYMRLALDESKKSPPSPHKFCVGALLVSPSSSPCVLATGYSLELPGNTHAEQCCLSKIATRHGVQEADVGRFLPEDTVLYTTMEPCNRRLNDPVACVQRILRCKDSQGRSRIRTVYVGITEPDKFVGVNQGQSALREGGVEVSHVGGLEAEIRRAAMAGHDDA